MITSDTLRDYGYGAESDWQPVIATLCINSAKKYLKRAGVPERTDDAEYDMAILMLATHWYDNRGVQLIGTVGGEIAKGLNAIIHQLQNDPEEDTSGGETPSGDDEPSGDTPTGDEPAGDTPAADDPNGETEEVT